MNKIWLAITAFLAGLAAYFKIQSDRKRINSLEAAKQRAITQRDIQAKSSEIIAKSYTDRRRKEDEIIKHPADLSGFDNNGL